MTALRSGENRPWPESRLTVYVAGARVAALLLGADGRAVAAPWVDVVTPARPGLAHLDGAVEGVTVVPDVVDAAVARVVVVASGYTAAPTAQLLTADGAVALTVTPERLTSETALVMVEAYRRDGAWKVRALAQGYDGGLAALAAAYGATPPPSPAPTVDDPVRRIGMILDDASRTTASLEASAAFADRRLEDDLEQIVGDPALRVGPRGEAARAEAQRRRDDLVTRARQRHSTDLAQLTAEINGLAAALPPSLAPWDAPGWRDPSAGVPPRAFRLGDLALESAPGFRLPMVRALPLAPPLWIETDDGGDEAARMLAALTRRLMVARPRVPRLAVVDVGGHSALDRLPSSAPPATDPTTATRMLQEHVEHVTLVLLARRSGGLDDLPPEHRPGRLVLVPDFPHGLDDAAVAAVQQLVTHGADAGLDLVLSGRRPQALGVPLLDLLHDACLRVPSAPGGDLVDSFGGVGWIFHPDLGPDDPSVAERLDDALRRRITESERPGA